MANEIHPSAIIDSSAELGDDIVVGPYCVINAGVKLGNGCHLSNHVTLDGPTDIGEGNQFFSYTSIGQRTQDLKYDGEPTHLKIGDHNTFREFCTVNRATSAGDATIVGNHGNFLAYTHIGHDCIVGDHVVFSKQRDTRRPRHHRRSCDPRRTHRHSSILPDRSSSITGGFTKIRQDVLLSWS